MVDGKFKCEWPYVSLYDINMVGMSIYECMWWCEWSENWSENEKNIQKLFNFFDIILLLCGVNDVSVRWGDDMRGW